MKKTVTQEVEIYICDLCGKDINNFYGPAICNYCDKLICKNCIPQKTKCFHNGFINYEHSTIYCNSCIEGCTKNFDPEFATYKQLAELDAQHSIMLDTESKLREKLSALQ